MDASLTKEIDVSKNKPQRNKSIELLRVVLMFMIVAHHLSRHGGIVYDSFGINSSILAVFGLGGNIATNVFILITGFYSLNSRFHYKKILRLILEVTFYQILLNIAGLITGNSTFSVNWLLTTLLPVFFGGGYWFIVRYLQLYLLTPMINIGIKGVGQKIHLTVVAAFGIMFSIFPLVIGKFFTVQDYEFNTLVWFVWLYCVGAYMGLYGSVLFKKRKTALFLLLSSVAVLTAFSVIKDYFSFEEVPSGIVLKAVRKASMIFGDASRNAPLMVAVSILLFVVFHNSTIKLPNIIYPVAGSVFGIYILHDNRQFRDFMWKTVCGTTRMQDSPLFPLYAIAIVILIFTVCCLIDVLVRKVIFKPIYKKTGL